MLQREEYSFICYTDLWHTWRQMWLLREFITLVSSPLHTPTLTHSCWDFINTNLRFNEAHSLDGLRNLMLFLEGIVNVGRLASS
jgi:hypothetical protein